MNYIPNDTLLCDTTKIAVWQSNPSYDYNSELMKQDINIFQWLADKFYKWFSSFFNNSFISHHQELFIILFSLAILALIAWFIYKKRPDLFSRVKKQKISYAVDEDTIYGVDFDKEIKKTLSTRNYKEGVRLVYLQTLKQLSDKKRLDWQLYKTPTQYLYEVKTPSFREMTNLFLRIRYGDFQATSNDFQRMLVLQSEIQKGGEV